MVSAIVAQFLSFLFTSFVVVLVLNMMHEGDYIHFIKLLIVSAIMLFIYPYIIALSPSIAFFINAFIVWLALIKITSEEVTFTHAAITAIIATIFTNFLLPMLVGLL